MRADAADTLYQDQRLNEVSLHAELLNTAVVVSDEYFRIADELAVSDQSRMDRFFQ
jgi:hypothetical protein